MKKIAIIEDDKGLNNGIALALKNEEYEFIQCYSFLEAKKSMKDLQVDLIVLDINLPDGNGFEYLKEIRKHSEVPVIILTANDLETDEVMGLELGADDYITKPFSLMVLRARIKKALEKSSSLKKLDIYENGELLFDFNRMYFSRNHQEIELSKTEQKLLKIWVKLFRWELLTFLFQYLMAWSQIWLTKLLEFVMLRKQQLKFRQIFQLIKVE